MMLKSECGRVQELLALSVGQDVSDEDRVETRLHMARCAACREYHVRVRAGYQVLEQVRVGTAAGHPYASSPSLWPEVRARLLARRTRPAAQAFNAWLPVGALAAACLALLVVTDSFPRPDSPAFVDPETHAVQPIGDLRDSRRFDRRDSEFGRPRSPFSDRSNDDFHGNFNDGQNLKFERQPPRMAPVDSNTF